MQGETADPRVLVTGAAGFVGRHCLTELVEGGDEIHAVSSLDQNDKVGGATWHRVNLLDAGEAAGLVARVRPTHLLHLAWETTHGRFWASEDNERWLMASMELFRAFADHGGRRAVMAGTVAEYRWDNQLCVEGTTPLEPLTLYGASKHALHVAAQAYAAEAGVSLAWGRVFFLYGPGEKAGGRLVPSVVVPLLRGEPAACSHGRQIRDFLHVEDVASAFTELLASDVTGPLNVASGIPVSVAEVAEAIGEIIGRPDLVRLGAIPTRADDPEFLVADVARLADEVGWQPSYDLHSGLRQTVEWWRDSLDT